MSIHAEMMNGSSIVGTGRADQRKEVYYVRLNMAAMRRIFDYYTREEPMIASANAIRSYQALGQGFYLEFAEKEAVMPEDVYDYTASVQSTLETVSQWCDMFGFVAFALPEPSAREEIARIENSDAFTQEEIADRLLQRCTEEMNEQLGMNIELPDRAKRDRGADANTPEAESRRMNLLTRAPPPGSKEEVNELARRMNKQTMVTKSRYDGDALSAANADMEIVSKEFNTVSRTMQEEVTQRTNLTEILIALGEVKIMDLDAGEFYLQIDDLLMKKTIVWVPKSRLNNLGIGGSGGPSSAGGVCREIQFDPNVSVFVWPNRMPTRDGIIQTHYYELIRKRAMIEEALDNLGDADFAASHPTPFIQKARAPSTADIMELPENDIYGQDVIGQDRGAAAIFGGENMTGSERLTYRREVRDAVMLEMTVEARNDAALQQRAQELMQGRARATRATRHGLSVADFRAGAFEKSGIMHLPGGLVLGGTVMPTTLSSVSELYTMYQQELSFQLGVPLSYIRGDQTGSKTTSSGGGSSNSALTDGAKRMGSGAGGSSVAESLLRTSIMRYRENASAFFDFMYDSVFHDQDTAKFKQELTKVYKLKADADEAREAITKRMKRAVQLIEDIAAIENTLASHLSHAARLCSLEMDLKKLISMRYRLRLKFLKTPFVDNETVTAMYNAGAVSHLELANIMRQNAGLTTLTDKEIEANLKDMLDQTQKRAVAATPTPPNTSTTEIVESEAKGSSKTSSGGGGDSGAGKKPGAAKSSGSDASKTSSKRTVITEVQKDDDSSEEKSKPKKKKKKGDD